MPFFSIKITHVLMFKARVFVYYWNYVEQKYAGGKLQIFL